MQPIVAFNNAHQCLLTPVIVAVTDNLSVEADPVDEQVDVLVVGVVVACEDVLVRAKPHVGQVALRDGGPRCITQVFPRCCRERNMQHCFTEGGPQFADLAKFPR